MITILDGFVDEPACLGVPPFISPHARYTVGAILDVGETYEYITVEQWRKGSKLSGKILIVLAGAVVPGRYLRGMPLSFKEFISICASFRGTKILIGAAARFGFGQGGGKPRIDGSSYVDFSVSKDGDAFIYDFLNGTVQERNRKKSEWKKWSVIGAEVVKCHPDYPQPLIAEIETYRGCVRWFTGGCSFCLEPYFGKPLMRDVGDIIKEVKTLRACGITNFRLGGQSCFFSYRAHGIGKTETPQPNPSAIKQLLKSIGTMNPTILHIDNVNPAVVAEWKKESREIIELIVTYCTSGNTAALGMESADERVIKENNLNATPEQVFDAVKLINEIGSTYGNNGMPAFLPGLNILCGLRGEEKETYNINYKFLKELVEKHLLLRRINIRQVVYQTDVPTRINKAVLRSFKELINTKINKIMLERMLPKGRILKDVYLEITKGNNTFGRQIGSYPLLVHLPYKTETNKFVNVKVVNPSYKSISTLEYPININKASFDILKCLPYVGERRAAKLVTHRPFKKLNDIKKILEDIEEKNELMAWVSL